MSVANRDHQAIANSRVALQYQESPKFLGYLAALIAAPIELDGVLQTIAQQTDIDQAQGVTLDVIGEIVGIDRIVPNSIKMKFFGFGEYDNAVTFGEEENLSIGGRFRSETEPANDSSVLTDPEYRLLIKAKIIKNHSKGTSEDILKGLSFLFTQNEPVQIILNDMGNMVIQIAVGRDLTLLEKAMITDLDILPRPAGVRISQRVSYKTANYFGFDDQYGALTFSEDGQPSNGGQFAEEF